MNAKALTSLAETGVIMDSISKAPENFNKSKEQLNAAMDNQKMMEAIAKYKASHTTLKKEYNINRNDPCPCGSGKKYKKCCLDSGKYEQLVVNR